MITAKFKEYRKKGAQPMTPWVAGMDTEGVSISVSDIRNGSPKDGDMVAQNPKDKTDMWLVAARFFNDNYEKV